MYEWPAAGSGWRPLVSREQRAIHWVQHGSEEVLRRIRSADSHPGAVAELFGVSDRLGSLEKGKIANLVVTKGDLFQDRTEVKYVFIDGLKFEPTPEAPAAGPEATR